MPRIKRSLRNNALRSLQKSFSADTIKDNQSSSSQTRGFSRRKFIGDVTKAATIISMPALYSACQMKNDKTQPVIAIIGGGIAGLHAAFILKNAGYQSTIYEATQRPGGRILTVNDMMGPGLWTEMGGEFIDTTHEDMLNLAAHFKLPLLDRQSPENIKLKEYAYYFQQKHLQEEDLLKALAPFRERIRKDIDSLSEEITFENFSADDKRLDEMSIVNYMQQLGINGWLFDFINAAFTSEYGTDASDQSSINMLSIFDVGDAKSYKLFGTSDERFSIIGGNSKLCEALAKDMKEQILYDHRLLSLNQNSSGQYLLTFGQTGGKKNEVKADFVLLALPFTLLREVDIKMKLPEWKINAIRNLSYGMNSKLFIGVKERLWRQQGYSGYAFADNLLMNGYDHTEMQTHNEGPGGYTVNLGGKQSLQIGNTEMQVLQKIYLEAFDQVFPGAIGQFNDKFQKWFWPSYEFSKASYTSFKPGQYTTISGATMKPVDKLFFAGEHCSYEFQGFMNGGAQTGRLAASAILDLIRKK
ncbi:MAG: FAD-dependent oxidoreductase [Bacteroidetes bacterium]|nr:FAD-dependent oxidoreductase [Bacteroidota bacterium]